MLSCNTYKHKYIVVFHVIDQQKLKDIQDCFEKILDAPKLNKVKPSHNLISVEKQQF